MCKRFLWTRGVVSIGASYKNLSDYISLFNRDGEFDGEDYEFLQPLNGDSATAWGIELQYQNQFRRPPAPFDRFGLLANFTWADSEAEYPGREGDKASLPGQSDTVGNVGISYEKGWFSGLLSYDSHGKYIDEVGEVATFGDLEGPGALMKVETLMLDARANRILIAEESAEAMRFKIYDLDGAYTGQDVDDGLFTAEPEGLALWTCGEDGGYWVATDQHKDLSVFHVLNRKDFSLIGSFVGKTVANTDGVGLTREPTERFPEGAFYAVHDDQGVGAWDLRDIAAAIGLDSVCP